MPACKLLTFKKLFTQIMDGFREPGFPHFIGALDGCHIPVIVTIWQMEEYINIFSVLLEGTYDHMVQFIH